MEKHLDKAMREMADKLNKRMEELYVNGVKIQVDTDLDDDDFRPIIGSWMNSPVPQYGGIVHSVAGDPPCFHNFECDYESAFTKQKYYSCTRCGKKQEDL